MVILFVDQSMKQKMNFVILGRRESSMGLIVKNTTYDSGEDEIPIGTEVFIPLTDEKGIVVMKFGNLYQVETSSGVKTYTRSELEAV